MSALNNVRISHFDRRAVLQWLTEQRAAGKFTVIDVGGSMVSWSSSVVDAIVDLRTPTTSSERTKVFRVNLCTPADWQEVDDYVALHGKFDFSICTHTLEDVANPRFVCDKLPQISKAGYIAVPSKYSECARLGDHLYRGYLHHRWILSVREGRFMAFPKLGFIEFDNRFDALAHADDDLSDLSFWWQDSISLEVVNNDFIGPDTSTALALFNALLMDDLDPSVAQWLSARKN